jgi:ferredoxin
MWFPTGNFSLFNAQDCTYSWCFQMKRKIIEIDEDKCNGCRACIPNCPEGALQVIDGKARLISDLFCDGLGACVGHCPQGAMQVIEREAEPYDEYTTMGNIAKKGENTIKAHLVHLKDHGETAFYNEAIRYLKDHKIKVPKLDDLPCGCPGSAMRTIKPKGKAKQTDNASALTQWPVQLKLLPVRAPFFENSHLLISADCVAYANPNFHSKLLYGKSLAIGCPKLDDVEFYIEKLSQIFSQNKIKSVTVAIMEVPCCSGMDYAVREAVKKSGKSIPIITEVIGVDGAVK